MKVFLFLALSFVVSIAFACPGGHLKILNIQGQRVGEINVIENTVSLHVGLDFANIVWNDDVRLDNPAEELPKLVKVVGDQKVFNLQDLKGVILSQDPGGRLVVFAVPYPNSMTTYYWVVSDFKVARGLTCANEIEAEVAH